jgi:hypothetical protein
MRELSKYIYSTGVHQMWWTPISDDLSSVAKPVTAGGLPMIAALTAIDRATQYSTMAFPRMNHSVTDSLPSTAQQSSRTFLNPRSAAASQTFLQHTSASPNDTRPVSVANKKPSRDSSFRFVRRTIFRGVFRITPQSVRNKTNTVKVRQDKSL